MLSITLLRPVERCVICLESKALPRGRKSLRRGALEGKRDRRGRFSLYAGDFCASRGCLAPSEKRDVTLRARTIFPLKIDNFHSGGADDRAQKFGVGPPPPALRNQHFPEERDHPCVGRIGARVVVRHVAPL